LNRGVPRGTKKHSLSGVRITRRTTGKVEIINKSKQLAQRVLKKIEKKQSGPAPPSPLELFTAQTSTTPPGTKPLGVGRQEPSTPEEKGLRNGILAWRLKKTCCRRPGEAIADEVGGSDRLTTFEYGG
jgi:hypothetical protein